jgi:hypothetical protein
MKKKFGTSLRLTLCVSLLAAIALSFPTSSQAADPAPTPLNVTVTNTPLPVQGTVGVNNFPGTQNVSGTVNVGNFPASNTVTGSVSITGTPAVNVTNTVTNPVPTQNVGLGVATQVGQPASKVVSLSCEPQPLGGCVRRFRDGHIDAVEYQVPSGEALVITDVQWSFISSSLAPGSYDSFTINATSLVGLQVLTLSALVDASGKLAGQAHLSTGVVIDPGGFVSSSTTGVIDLQGYLVPNQ